MTRLLIILICLTLWINPIFAQSVNCVGAPPSRLVTGEQAQVIAIGGSNLRVMPSATADLMNVIPENELIPVIDGPYCAQSFTWWQVDYAGDRGWVAEGVDEFYWLAPYIIQRAQIGDIRIEIQPNLISNIRLERLADPLRTQFVLEGFPVTDNQITPFIVIFDDAPDDLTPDEIEGNTVSHVQSLELGTRFVDLYFVEPLREDTEITLVYRYMALIDDKRFVDAYFPISAPNLPLEYDPPQTNIQQYMNDYFENTLSALDALSNEDFTPTLSQLDGIVRSIRFNAPLEESNQFEFVSSGIRFDYNPILATTISEDLISADGNIPAHILLTLENYPLRSANIRIYRTEDVAGTTLSNLQQILNRQPSNPPRIPVLSQADAPLMREDLTYMRFINGEGIRYIASFEDGEQVYSYQGLSDNDDYFVSILLPIDDVFMPIAVLDRLVQSLQIGE